MKFFKKMKDGGPLSKVYGLFIVEIKALFSIVLLHFMDGSREAFHTHAFGAVSWVLSGKLTQHEYNGKVTVFEPSLKPIYTPRHLFHKVVSTGDTHVLTLRGPWVDEWEEYIPEEHKFIKLTHGRKIVREVKIV